MKKVTPEGCSLPAAFTACCKFPKFWLAVGRQPPGRRLATETKKILQYLAFVLACRARKCTDSASTRGVARCRKKQSAPGSQPVAKIVPSAPEPVHSPRTARCAHEGMMSAGWKSPPRGLLWPREAEGNRVAVRRGGEQPEANCWPEGVRIPRWPDVRGEPAVHRRSLLKASGWIQATWRLHPGIA